MKSTRNFDGKKIKKLNSGMQLFVFSIQSQRLLLLLMLSVLDVRYSNETPERIIILLFYVDKEWEHFAVMNLGVDDALRKWSRYII